MSAMMEPVEGFTKDQFVLLVSYREKRLIYKEELDPNGGDAIMMSRSDVDLEEFAKETSSDNTAAVFSAQHLNVIENWSRQDMYNAYGFSCGKRKVIRLNFTNGDSMTMTPNVKLALDAPGSDVESAYILAKDSLGCTLEGFSLDGSFVTVASIEEIGEEEVYNVMVDTNHNVYLKTINGSQLLVKDITCQQ